MTRPVLDIVRWLLPVVAICALHGGTAMGLILYPGDELLTGPGTPAADVVGKWSTNATFVVIGPNHIITTTHQGTLPATVQIAGQTYDVIYNSAWVGGPFGGMDVRVCRLEKQGTGLNANLTSFVPIYTYADEIGRTVVMGGYGKIRGSSLGSPTYGYQWAANTTGELHWGVNVIDAIGNGTLEIDFDKTSTGGYVPNEAALAEYDSGGGWFVQRNGTWRLLGLSSATDRFGASWFDNPSTGFYDPDWNYGTRISEAAGWINTIMGYVPIGGDADRDSDVDYEDYKAILQNFGSTPVYWQNGDFDEDGDVDYEDYKKILQNFGYYYIAPPLADGESLPSAAGPVGVPEPLTAALLAAGALTLLRRRRRPAAR